MWIAEWLECDIVTLEYGGSNHIADICFRKVWISVFIDTEYFIPIIGTCFRIKTSGLNSNRSERTDIR